MALRVTTEQIAQTDLFKGLSLDAVKEMLSHTGIMVKHFHRNDYVYLAGDVMDNLCVVMTGKIQAVKEDIWGEKSIVSKLEAGDTFAENHFGCKDVHSQLSYLAVQDCDVFMLPFSRMTINVIQNVDTYTKFLSNLVTIIAHSNAQLMDKVDVLGKRTLRSKIMAYLEQEAEKKHSKTFEIPFNRTDLANYLDADRSAMTRELCRMRDEGIIKFEKNVFVILQPCG